MSEEKTNKDRKQQGKAGQYVRWFLISTVMLAIVYTVIMAAINKFGGA